MVRQLLVGQGLPIFEASRLHSDKPHLARVHCTSGQPDAQPSKQTSMPPAIFESAIPASERTQPHALYCATIAINGEIAYIIQTRLNQIT